MYYKSVSAIAGGGKTAVLLNTFSKGLARCSGSNWVFFPDPNWLCAPGANNHEGHTLYIRHQKGELGRRFERLYLALRRLAREINGFSYTDYSGWRRPDGVSTTLPLWIEASDPSHGRKFIFTQKGPALQTTIRYADGTKKQRIYRRKEDMAAELMTMFQEELRVYPPWSEDRRNRYEY